MYCDYVKYAQPCVQATRLRRRVSGANQAKFGYNGIVVSWASRRALNALVRFFLLCQNVGWGFKGLLAVGSEPFQRKLFSAV